MFYLGDTKPIGFSILPNTKPIGFSISLKSVMSLHHKKKIGSKICSQLGFSKQMMLYLGSVCRTGYLCSLGLYQHTNVMEKINISNWCLNSNKYLSQELNLEQGQTVPCAAVCWMSHRCPVSCDSFLCSPWGTGVICNRTHFCVLQGKQARGDGRKQQACIKRSWSS